MASMYFDVFLSYRRRGGAELAQLLHIALAARGYSVFLDVNDLVNGPFDDALYSRIDHSIDVITILSPGALDGPLDNDDWFRREQARAIVTKKNLIPVIVEGFQMPAPASLPADIADLCRQEGVLYTHFHARAAIEKLLTFLKSTPRLNISAMLQLLPTVAGMAGIGVGVGLMRRGGNESLQESPVSDNLAQLVACGSEHVHFALQLINRALSRLFWRLKNFTNECHRASFGMREVRRLRAHFDTITTKFESEHSLCLEILTDIPLSAVRIGFEAGKLLRTIYFEVSQSLRYRFPSRCINPYVISAMIADAEKSVQQSLPQLQTLVLQSRALVDEITSAVQGSKLVLADKTPKI